MGCGLGCSSVSNDTWVFLKPSLQAFRKAKTPTLSFPVAFQILWSKPGINIQGLGKSNCRLCVEHGESTDEVLSNCKA